MIVFSHRKRGAMGNIFCLDIGIIDFPKGLCAPILEILVSQFVSDEGNDCF